MATLAPLFNGGSQGMPLAICVKIMAKYLDAAG